MPQPPPTMHPSSRSVRRRAPAARTWSSDSRETRAATAWALGRRQACRITARARSKLSKMDAGSETMSRAPSLTSSSFPSPSPSPASSASSSSEPLALLTVLPHASGARRTSRRASCWREFPPRAGTNTTVGSCATSKSLTSANSGSAWPSTASTTCRSRSNTAAPNLRASVSTAMNTEAPVSYPGEPWPALASPPSRRCPGPSPESPLSLPFPAG